ncbi:OmpP1/FadL family transporter [Pedobacter ginsengisoli]|uniref:OmpP1/FadL family transporter n=1 Tax=Pedobacter ginsengisoli TaxID=363852 RepID=UPI002550F848|nr:outer membrane protein transport protein [Pedobacter ginsengisoli]
MKKITLSLVVTVAATVSTYAQSYAPDALKFSQTNYGSTARFKGMGGAQIGVGGDMSSLGGNPAGLGLFTKSEFGLTPEFNGMTGKASFLNTTTDSNKDRLNLNNLGVVLYSPSLRAKGESMQTGVVSSVFGIGYARNNDFGADFSYTGVNSANSIADYFTDDANAYNKAPNQLPEGSLGRMAFDGFIIDYDDFTTPSKPFYRASTRNNSDVQTESNTQRQGEMRSGSTSELTAGGALNIANQVYIGASIGLVNVRYTNDAQYFESGYNFTEDSRYDLTFAKNQETTGSGFNARLGVIFRPVGNFRIGATMQTPTWLLIEDNTTFKLDTRIATGPNAKDYTNAPANYTFTYRLRTPLKGSLGASYVIGGKALISADVDYIDYSTIRFSTDQGNDPDRIIDENNTVKNFYKGAVNYRLGAEYKVDNAFSLRGGYGNNGSAIKGDDDGYFDTKYYSGGLGYRVNNYYFDLTYQRAETNTDLSPYIVGSAENPEEPVANIKTARNNVFLTFGVRF